MSVRFPPNGCPVARVLSPPASVVIPMIRPNSAEYTPLREWITREGSSAASFTVPGAKAMRTCVARADSGKGKTRRKDSRAKPWEDPILRTSLSRSARWTMKNRPESAMNRRATSKRAPRSRVSSCRAAARCGSGLSRPLPTVRNGGFDKTTPTRAGSGGDKSARALSRIESPRALPWLESSCASP